MGASGVSRGCGEAVLPVQLVPLLVGDGQHFLPFFGVGNIGREGGKKLRVAPNSKNSIYATGGSPEISTAWEHSTGLIRH